MLGKSAIVALFCLGNVLAVIVPPGGLNKISTTGIRYRLKVEHLEPGEDSSCRADVEVWDNNECLFGDILTIEGGSDSTKGDGGRFGNSVKVTAWRSPDNDGRLIGSITVCVNKIPAFS